MTRLPLPRHRETSPDGFGKYNSVMLQTPRILVRALSHAMPAVIAAGGLLTLTGCGQTGNLYLPKEPAAANRATLPQSMWPAMPDKKTGGTSTTPAPGQSPAPASTNAPASP